MAKKKTKQSVEIIDVNKLQSDYKNELDSNPIYSLLPDPTGEYHLTDTEKTFIRHYVNFKSIGTAAEYTGIDNDLAKQIFSSYSVQSEIRRISKALYHHQFSAKLLSLDDIGGYLSSLLIGDNVPLAEQLTTSEKLRVVDMIIKLNEMKTSAIINPSELIHKDIEVQLKNLSVNTIQRLLQQNSYDIKKEELISKLDSHNLSIEEKAYLSTLSIEELTSLIEDIYKKEEDK